MPEPRLFNGFFSYARHDADTDPGLIKAFTERLEDRINTKLANARFKVWRDTDDIRTGNNWDTRIETVLRRSDVFILLLSPRWIESQWCRDEYRFFEDQVESKITVGEYVAPVLIRSIEGQKSYLLPDQLEIYTSVHQRQYFEANAIDFLQLRSAQRAAKIDRLADDIVGMIHRLRDPAVTSGASEGLPRYRRRASEFGGQPEDYAQVDFLRSCEVIVDPVREENPRGVYAQADFVERLFVKSQKAYVEFGVSRAYLTLGGAGAEELRKFDGFRVVDPLRAAYVTLREEPSALSIAMNAKPGTGLSHLALPPIDGNYWSQIATATSSLSPGNVKVVLSVSFSPYGLYLADEASPSISQTAKRKIKAILTVALEKNERFDRDDRIQRSIPISERAQ